MPKAVFCALKGGKWHDERLPFASPKAVFWNVECNKLTASGLWRVVKSASISRLKCGKCR